MRSRICQECWKSLGDAQTAAKYGYEEYWDQRRASEYCPSCNLHTRDWEQGLPGYECILQHMVTKGPGNEMSGWFLLVDYDSKSAIITNYEENESSYSSQAGMDTNHFVWQGPVDMLISMATLLRDPKFPDREMLPEDINYQHWCCFFSGICSWAQLGCPDWSGTHRLGPGRPIYLRRQPKHRTNQTPFAKNMTALYHQHSHAATTIQAAWRGWKTRMSVLWNPHTVIGKRKLAAEADRETEPEKKRLCC